MAHYKASGSIQGLSKELNDGDVVEMKDTDAAPLVALGALTPEAPPAKVKKVEEA